MTAWLWSLTGYQFGALAAALAAVGANAAIWGPVLWRIWRLPRDRPIPGADQALANVQPRTRDKYVTVTCAECTAELDVTEARGPDGGGDYHCTDLDACDARVLAIMEGLVDGI